MSRTPDWTIRRGFPEHLRAPAAKLYFEAFSGKLGGLLGRDGRGVRFFERVLDPDFALAAVTADEKKLLGIAGFKTEEGAMTGGDLSDLAAIYGWFGTLWRTPILMLLERDRTDGQLLMDGIAVVPEARGMGVGSALLEAIIAEAAQRQLEGVRLDVIDTNPRARALYERFGFVAQSTEQLGPFRHVFGFVSATRMVLDVPAWRKAQKGGA